MRIFLKGHKGERGNQEYEQSILDIYKIVKR